MKHEMDIVLNVDVQAFTSIRHFGTMIAIDHAVREMRHKLL